MMGWIRPEVRDWLLRWREALVGAGILLVGVYWAVTGLGVLSWLGWGLVLLGPVLICAGVQRGRFRSGTGGPGAVRIDEGQVAYFGPLTGGIVAMSEMTRLSLDSQSSPPVWVLEQPGQPELAVPLTADGADDLFDVFAALPGIKTDQMLEQMRTSAPLHRVVIWERTRPRLH